MDACAVYFCVCGGSTRFACLSKAKMKIFLVVFREREKVVTESRNKKRIGSNEIRNRKKDWQKGLVEVIMAGA